MATRDSLGTRMKEYYEAIPKTRLMRRTPVAIRIDGKAFHTFTSGFQKPFDKVLMTTMQETMKYLCENVQGCVFGYTQSDEITLILLDYQKIASISASMATMFFNRRFAENVAEFKELIGNTPARDVTDADLSAIRAYDKALKMGAMFDSRVFNIPKEEVCNLVYWRQQDATRNSIQMVGRAYFSHKELQNKNTSNIQDMLEAKFNVNWNNYPIACKRGSACIKGEDGKWFVDLKMPILKNKDRKYVDDLIYIGET